MSDAHLNNTKADGERSLAAVILAAGRGTRMPGDVPKVVCEVAGRPMVRWVVEAVRRAGVKPIVLVVGHNAQEVCRVFRGDDGDIIYARQESQRGTADAIASARSALSGLGGDLLVLAADGPLIRTSTIRRLVEHHRRTGAAATLATARIDDPTGYGRILRDRGGRFHAIVEHTDASADERAICEVYPSYACFDTAMLFDEVARLKPDAGSNEYRITDVPASLRARGLRVELLNGIPPEDVLSINTPQQLREVQSILLTRMEQSHELG
ncbi:MAG: NTP transferase domain-containing protein [Planctomycetes bacterium]|nr:NTP transferase domain-containing protein [Planctomycetota bacterium]